MRSDFPIVVALALALGLGGRRRSQAFVESWFGKLKERCVWRATALLFWGTPSSVHRNEYDRDEPAILRGQRVVDDQGRGVEGTVDWEAIERSPDFQELAGRRRFAWTATGLGTGLGVLYVVLAGVAHDLMGTKLIGSFSLGFAGGVLLIVVTWGITITYIRRSDRVWGPLEARIREQALPSSESTAQPVTGAR